MKKRFTILLAIAMLASMSVTAFAADDGPVTTDGGSKEISVNAKYVDGVSTPDVISADIEWGAMELPTLWAAPRSGMRKTISTP